MPPRRKVKWYKDTIKLHWIFIAVSSVVLLLELFNMFEIKQIRNDLFNYYLWP